MIKLSNNGSGVKVFTSETMTVGYIDPTNYTGTQIITLEHTLGAIPDRVDIICTGDTSEAVHWAVPTGPYGQAPDCDYGHNPFIGEVGNIGASCYSKSSTNFKVVFCRSWSGKKVYFKAYLYDGIHRAS